MKKPIRTIALGCAACLLVPAVAQALIIDAAVELDALTGRYGYSYTLQNTSTTAGERIASFSLPFFGDPASALIADSIEAPAFWAFGIVTPAAASWPYARGDDPAAPSYQPLGVDYTDPDFILQFSLAPPDDLIGFLGAIDHAQATLLICSIGDRCSDEEIAALAATVESGNQWQAALIDGGESLSGFVFDSLLGPAVGPGLIMTTSGGVSYSAPFLPLTYGMATDPVPVPEPSPLWLFGAALIALVTTHRASLRHSLGSRSSGRADRTSARQPRAIA